MRDTITALFKDEAQAESAMRALKEAKFDRASTELRSPVDAEVPDFGANAARGVATPAGLSPVRATTAAVAVMASAPTARRRDAERGRGTTESMRKS